MTEATKNRRRRIQEEVSEDDDDVVVVAVVSLLSIETAADGKRRGEEGYVGSPHAYVSSLKMQLFLCVGQGGQVNNHKQNNVKLWHCINLNLL